MTSYSLMFPEAPLARVVVPPKAKTLRAQPHGDIEPCEAPTHGAGCRPDGRAFPYLIVREVPFGVLAGSTNAITAAELARLYTRNDALQSTPQRPAVTYGVRRTVPTPLPDAEEVPCADL